MKVLRYSGKVYTVDQARSINRVYLYHLVSENDRVVTFPEAAADIILDKSILIRLFPQGVLRVFSPTSYPGEVSLEKEWKNNNAMSPISRRLSLKGIIVINNIDSQRETVFEIEHFKVIFSKGSCFIKKRKNFLTFGNISANFLNVVWKDKTIPFHLLEQITVSISKGGEVTFSNKTTLNKNNPIVLANSKLELNEDVEYGNIKIIDNI